LSLIFVRLEARLPDSGKPLELAAGRRQIMFFLTELCRGSSPPTTTTLAAASAGLGITPCTVPAAPRVRLQLLALAASAGLTPCSRRGRGQLTARALPAMLLGSGAEGQRAFSRLAALPGRESGDGIFRGHARPSAHGEAWPRALRRPAQFLDGNAGNKISCGHHPALRCAEMQAPRSLPMLGGSRLQEGRRC